MNFLSKYRLFSFLFYSTFTNQMKYYLSENEKNKQLSPKRKDFENQEIYFKKQIKNENLEFRCKKQSTEIKKLKKKIKNPFLMNKITQDLIQKNKYISPKSLEKDKEFTDTANEILKEYYNDYNLCNNSKETKYYPNNFETSQFHKQKFVKLNQPDNLENQMYYNLSYNIDNSNEYVLAKLKRMKKDKKNRNFANRKITDLSINYGNSSLYAFNSIKRKVNNNNDYDNYINSFNFLKMKNQDYSIPIEKFVFSCKKIKKEKDNSNANNSQSIKRTKTIEIENQNENRIDLEFNKFKEDVKFLEKKALKENIKSNLQKK